MNTLALFFDWLLAASARASVLTVAVLAVRFLLRHQLSPHWRHALWLPVLVVLLMPVFPESRWSLGSTLFVAPTPVQVPLLPLETSVTAEVLDTAPAVMTAPASEPVDWRQIAMLAWLTGAAGLLLCGSFSLNRVLRRFKATRQPPGEKLQTLIEQTVREVGLRRAPEVWISPAISSPAVAGLLRPRLLLPAEFDHAFTLAEVRLILRHELTHLRRHDLPVNALLCVLVALHWFNPLLWLAFFQVRADRESACDSEVLADATHASRVEYGHALLKVESAFSPLSLSLGFVGIFQRGAALRSRIRCIAAQRRATPLAALLATICILLLTFLGITRAQPPAAAPEEQPFVALEIKLLTFDQATEWNFNGRLPQKSQDQLMGVVLSAEEMDQTLREVTRQKTAKLNSYPRMVGKDNQEVHIRSVVNQPYKDEHGKAGLLPIGLVLKVTPQMQDEAVLLKVDLADSRLIDPNTGAAIPSFDGDFPTVRTLSYQSTHSFPQGRSLVLAGWDDGKPESKRPALYMITPVLVDPKKGGLQAALSLVSDKAASAGGHTVGKSAFRPGDSIHITSVTRTAALLSVSFEYELASAERAVLALSITSLNEKKSALPDRRQNMDVLKGKGAGTLHQANPYPGLPHLTFYSPEDRSALGGIYFGTAAEAAASQKLDLAYMLKDRDTTDTSKPRGVDAIKANHAKLQSIIVPEVQFNNTTLQEAVQFMRTKARELDPAKEGVPFLLLPNDLAAGMQMSLHLQNVPLSEMLRYVTQLANMKYVVTPDGVAIASIEDLKKHILTTGRPVTQALIAQAAQDGTGAATLLQDGADKEPPGTQLILPEVKLRDTPFEQAIDFVQTQARGLDPAKKGVTILIRPGGDLAAPITLDLKDVPVLEAVKYIAALGHYSVTVKPYAILLQPQGK